jgi:hypothetical protein
MSRSSTTRLTVGPLFLELSDAQVASVIRQTAGTGRLSLALDGLAERPRLDEGPFLNRKLSRSLLYGLALYAAFPRDGTYLGVAQLARHLGLKTSTTYRYIQTLLTVGLVERDPTSRQYRHAA